MSPKQSPDVSRIKRRVRRQYFVVAFLVYLTASCVWIWRTIDMRTELSAVLAKTVERDLQVGDTRNSIMNLHRAGASFFREIEFVEADRVQFKIDGQKASPITYRLVQSVRGSTSSFDTAKLTFRFDPTEDLWWFLLVLSPLVLGFSYYDYRRSLFRTLREVERIGENSKAQARALLAKQLAHDIRSPVMALKALIPSLSAESEKQDLLKGVAKRIDDIANDLLLKERVTDEVKAENLSSVDKLIESIVAEKSTAHANTPRLEMDFKNRQELFASIDEVELSRALSNLIENAIEASNDGAISIGLREYGESLTISVQDEGRGIPEHLLKEIGREGFSYGKKGPKSGSGLGVFHAKSLVETAGGKFMIQSKEGSGTIVTLTLPRKF